MTLSETLIVAAVLALVLVIVALAMATIRNDLKQRQTWELLAMLDEALRAYYQAAAQQLGNKPDPAADRVIAALAAVPASRQVLERIPHRLRVRANVEKQWAGNAKARTGRWPAAAGRSHTWDRPDVTVQDAWGHPLQCLTAASPSPVHRQAVAANGGRPIFISAGVDGRFGSELDVAAGDDNLRSDELPR